MEMPVCVCVEDKQIISLSLSTKYSTGSFFSLKVFCMNRSKNSKLCFTFIDVKIDIKMISGDISESSLSFPNSCT